jgi:hypothetical protein
MGHARRKYARRIYPQPQSETNPPGTTTHLYNGRLESRRLCSGEVFRICRGNRVAPRDERAAQSAEDAVARVERRARGDLRRSARGSSNFLHRISMNQEIAQNGEWENAKKRKTKGFSFVLTYFLLADYFLSLRRRHSLAPAGA